MSAVSLPTPLRGLALAFGWRRVLFTFLFSFTIGALIGIHWDSGWWSAVVRVVAIGFSAMLVFGFFEQWPRRMPRWLAGLGMLASISQMIAVAKPLFGGWVVLPMLAPPGIANLFLIGCLFWKPNIGSPAIRAG